jgi:hypothetical protein
LGGIYIEVVVSPESIFETVMSMMLRFLPTVLSIAWSGIMTFDIIVFALTVYKAIKVGYKVLLIQVLIRDGTC